MITKSDFWKLLQSEFKQIRRSQLLKKKVMDSKLNANNPIGFKI